MCKMWVTEAILFTVLLSLYWLFSATGLHVSNETYYIKPTPSTPCPKEGASCFTLSQYTIEQKSNNDSSNISLIFLPGNHRLESELQVTRTESFRLLGHEDSLFPSIVLCSSKGRLSFENINLLTIRNIEFLDCKNNSVTRVEYFTLQKCIFKAGQNESVPDRLTSSRNPFLFLTATINAIPSNEYELRVGELGGTLNVNTSNVFIETCSFVRQSGVLVILNSNITIVNSIFKNTAIQNNSANFDTKAKFNREFNYNITFPNGTTISNTRSTTNDHATKNITNTFVHKKVHTYYGGVMYHENSSVIIQNSTFINNTAKAHGCIMACKNSKVIIQTSTFDSNTASENGGAMYCDNTNVTITNSVFTNNTANTYGGVIAHQNSNVIITNSTFINNTASDGPVMFYQNSNVTISNSTFTSNTALYLNSAVIHQQYRVPLTFYFTMTVGEETMSNLEIHNSTFVQNKANHYFGSVIRCDATASWFLSQQNKYRFNNVTISNTLFSDTDGLAVYGEQTNFIIDSSNFRNTLNANGTDDFNFRGLGGAMHYKDCSIIIKDSTFNNNTAAFTGGAIWLMYVRVKIQNSTFSKNKATINSVMDISDSSLDIENCTFAHNKGLEYGGVLSQYNSNISIHSTLFSNNTAATSFSGVMNIENSNVEIGNCVFTHNSAADFGGAMFIHEQSNVTIANSSFTNNVAEFAGAILIREHSNVTFKNTVFNNNTAETYYGGAIIMDNHTISTIDNSTFIHNAAPFGSAIVTLEESKVTICNSTFTNNTAYMYGGAIVIEQSEVAIDKTTYSSNSVTLTAKYTRRNIGGGGAIYINDSTVTIHNSKFIKNTAFNHGGGAILSGNCTITVNSSLFIGNKVANGSTGGAMSHSYSDVKLYSNLFKHNSAGFGGAIDIEGSNSVIETCTFINNVVYVSGGALNLLSSNATINNSSFINNRALHNVYHGNVTLNYTAQKGNGGAIFIGYRRGLKDIIEASDFAYEYSNFSNINSTAYGKLEEEIHELDQKAHILFDVNTKIYINRATFINNAADSVGGAIYANSAGSDSKRMQIESTDTAYTNNTSSIGGAIYINLASFYSNGYLNITKNTAKLGVVYTVQSVVYLAGNLTMVKNFGNFFSISSNVTFDGQTNILNNTHAANSQPTPMGGAISCYQSYLVLKGTTIIMHNRARNKSGGGVSLTESKLYVTGIFTIAHNTALNGGGIYAYHSELQFEGKSASILKIKSKSAGNVSLIHSNSADNKGGGIYTVGSSSRLLNGMIQVVKNTAKKGGGMFLEQNSKLYIIKKVYRNQDSDLVLAFYYNHAVYGGAIFVSDDSNSGACTTRMSTTEKECFLQAVATYDRMDDSISAMETFTSSVSSKKRFPSYVFFINNTATKRGMALYGGLLDRCNVNPFAEIYIFQDYTIDPITYMTMIADLQRDELKYQVSSGPVRICFCRDNIPNCSYNPPEVYTRKGETFTVSLVAVDHVNNTVSNSTILSYLSAEAGFREGQSIQTTNEECTELEYAVTSPHDSELLHIYANGTCKDIGISLQVVNITFLPCPNGFKEINSKCDCDPELTQYISNCIIDTESVLRRGNVWIAFMNTSGEQSLVIYKNCPFDYCHPPTKRVWINLNIPDDADKQCAFSRSGKLCGACTEGLSLSFANSHCLPCSNNWLGLLTVFAIAGVALVTFILVCNLTVAVGTINGLIFYANIITVNRAIFLPFQNPNIVTVFIAWLNLDFGFETCFYDGMDSYAKTWLQLAFPLYIISLVAAIIVISDYSVKFAALFTRGKDPIATLATLILLSYAKLIRTIIDSLSFTTLEYSDGSHEVVWLTDANVQYLKGKHIPLFITALIVVVVGTTYTLLLFTWQLIVLIPDIKPFTWITQNSKLIAFMNAYHNPYNKEHRYWIGLLLLARVLLYLVFAVNVLGDPRINLLCINTGVIILFFYQHAAEYKHKIHKTLFTDMLDNILLLNLVGFTSVTYYITGATNSQYIAAYISTGISFLIFLIILAYHMCVFILKKPLQKVISLRANRPAIPEINPEDAVNDSHNLEEELVSVTEINALPEPLDTEEDQQQEVIQIESDKTEVTVETNNEEPLIICSKISSNNTDNEVPNLTLRNELTGIELLTISPALESKSKEEGDDIIWEDETTPLLAQV